MQSVDESYDYVSLDNDANNMAAGDRKQNTVIEHVPADEVTEVGGIFEEYPPKSIRVLGEENGIHIFEDGHFYTEVYCLFGSITTYSYYKYSFPP